MKRQINAAIAEVIQIADSLGWIVEQIDSRTPGYIRFARLGSGGVYVVVGWGPAGAGEVVGTVRRVLGGW